MSSIENNIFKKNLILAYFEKILYVLVYILNHKIKQPYSAPTPPPLMASLAKRPRSSLSVHLRGKTFWHAHRCMRDAICFKGKNLFLWEVGLLFSILNMFDRQFTWFYLLKHVTLRGCNCLYSLVFLFSTVVMKGSSLSVFKWCERFHIW